MGLLRNTVVAGVASAASLVFAASPSLAAPDEVAPATGEGVNIPGMAFGVQRGGLCDPKVDTFGRNADGLTLVCVSDHDADSEEETHIWVRSAPLAGIRQVTSECEHESNTVALSPDNRLLQCLPNKSPSPKKRTGKDAPKWVWTVVQR